MPLIFRKLIFCFFYSLVQFSRAAAFHGAENDVFEFAVNTFECSLSKLSFFFEVRSFCLCDCVRYSVLIKHKILWQAFLLLFFFLPLAALRRCTVSVQFCLNICMENTRYRDSLILFPVYCGGFELVLDSMHFM